MKKIKPLLFSEYRIVYAKEITETRTTNRDYSLNCLIALMYSEYLTICGFNEVAEEVKILAKKLDKFFLGEENVNYDEYTSNNINSILNKLLK